VEHSGLPLYCQHSALVCILLSRVSTYTSASFLLSVGLKMCIFVPYVSWKRLSEGSVTVFLAAYVMWMYRDYVEVIERYLIVSLGRISNCDRPTMIISSFLSCPTRCRPSQKIGLWLTRITLCCLSTVDFPSSESKEQISRSDSD
jgi:hypothetical protein